MKRNAAWPEDKPPIKDCCGCGSGSLTWENIMYRAPTHRIRLRVGISPNISTYVIITSKKIMGHRKSFPYCRRFCLHDRRIVERTLVVLGSPIMKARVRCM